MQNSCQSSKLLWRLRLRRGSAVPPTSNGEGLRNIQHSMSIVLDMRFYIWFILTIYYKMRQVLWQNATAILLQNVTEVYHKMHQVFYYKMDKVFYYKMQQFYYKMWQLLQNVMILLQNATVITKCDVYYKLWQYIHLLLKPLPNMACNGLLTPQQKHSPKTVFT